MKKALLVLCLLSTVGFSKGLVVKGGVEYNYFKQDMMDAVKEMKVSDFISLIGEDKIKEMVPVFLKNGNPDEVLKSLKLVKDTKISMLPGVSNHLESSDLTKVKTHYLSAVLGAEYGFEVYRKGKVAFEVAPGLELKIGSKIRTSKEKEQFKMFNDTLNYERNETKKKWIEGISEDLNRAKKIQEEKNLDDFRKITESQVSQEEMEKELPIRLKYLEQKLENVKNDKDAQFNKDMPKMDFNYSVFHVQALATVTPRITYDYNEDVTLKAGVKLGLGLNHERIDFKLTTGDKTNVFTNKVNQLAIPYRLVLGVDYKHLTTDFEIGGTYLTRPEGKNSAGYVYKGLNTFSAGISVGYKF